MTNDVLENKIEKAVLNDSEEDKNHLEKSKENILDEKFLNDLMNITGELVLARNRIIQIATRFNDSELNSASQNLSIVTSEIQDKILDTGKISSISIKPALIVKSCKLKYAIPQEDIVELIRLSDDSAENIIEKIGDTEFYRLRGEILPLIRLNRILNSEIENDKTSRSVNIVVLSSLGKYFGLIIDSITDSEEIVIKPLSKLMDDSPIFSGVTILGDGSIAFVLEISKIMLRISTIHSEIENAIINEENIIEKVEDDLQSVLMFQVSENEQLAVPLSLVSRLEKIELNEIETIGGKEIIQYRGTSMPIIRLENLIGITSPEKFDEATIIVFELNSQNIGIYCAKILDTININLKLDKETFERKGLLGSLIIKDKVTLLLDVYSIIDMYDPTWFSNKRVSKKKSVVDSKVKILIVEDSQFWRSMEKSYLESLGYSVVLAVDGQAGLEKLHSGKFDLVITDLEMPVMDGFELVKNIKSDEKLKNLPIIAVSTLIDDHDKEKAFESGVDEYIIKLDKEILFEKINELLDKNKK